MKNPLTWDQLADHYDSNNSGRRARTLPMEKVFEWAENNTKLFIKCPNEGTLHLKGDAT